MSTEPVGDSAATQHFDKIGQIAITVGDFQRSRSFYRDILGMKHLFDAGNMAFFQCGEIRFMVASSEKPVAPSGTILYFKVDDIHGAHLQLQQQGVEFVQAPHMAARMPDHELWLAFLKDPDGNAIGIMSEIRAA